MPKRTDLDSILILGAGPIVIGQACEFDYSGVQAIKALKEEGYRVILVNSNPATIMTDPGLADATYIEPITPDFVEKVIMKERPDALLPTMGGQTALNTALALEREGVLARYKVEMIGAKADAIDKAENRERFRAAMTSIGLETPRAGIAHSWEEAEEALKITGLPAIIRPSFTLGGSGGGIAYNIEEFRSIVEQGLETSPATEVLIEESVLGWKEYEMEVVRDRADNAIIVCSLENIDPMGVHTGDSAAVAPALTLTDKEYQIMRNASLAVLREIGVETGGSNVQFAVNPQNGRMVVIEMNPRVSRSSALASKATGFPIAKIAAKLAVGYTLDELGNDMTGGATPASFEPTLDYIVTKLPRFAFEKYPGAEPLLTTSMKSVGEAMAIGRNFQESLQKALRSLETGLDGFDSVTLEGVEKASDSEEKRKVIYAELAKPTPSRLLIIAEALRYGFTVEEIYEACSIDPWFLRQIEDLIHIEHHLKEEGLPDSAEAFLDLKSRGFSDKRLGVLTGFSAEEIRKRREALNIHPVYKRVDSCAGEFKAMTPYLYSTYERGFEPGQQEESQEKNFRERRFHSCEALPSRRQKIVILGSGPNRIGQGLEFDYCCCHAAYAFQDMDIESIIINCNPETVSTDYDTADRLYFEPLTHEDVLNILSVEAEKGELLGVVVQYGGQTPLKLARGLEEAGYPLLGSSYDVLDLAEDRERFKALLDKLHLRQPPNATARSEEEAVEAAQQAGYPLMLRPSYVLGGQGMEIVHDETGLRHYVRRALEASGDTPVLIDHYLEGAIEVDVDALCDGEDVFVAGIMEHIEEAGVHSGDSACVLPPYSLSETLLEELRQQTRTLALGLGVCGLVNIQFAVQEGVIYVLEVNPRASRTVPFVAKATGVPLAGLGARVMAGKVLTDFSLQKPDVQHIAIKEAVFPWARFADVDTVLGPEMRSTGETMGLDNSFEAAFIKSLLGGGARLPHQGTVFISVKQSDKAMMVDVARDLTDMGFSILATGGTADFLKQAGLQAQPVNKVYEGRPHIVDAMKNGDIHLVFNTTEGQRSLLDSRSIRRTALQARIPYFTTAQGAYAATRALRLLTDGKDLEVSSLQAYIQAASS